MYLVSLDVIIMIFDDAKLIPKRRIYASFFITKCNFLRHGIESREEMECRGTFKNGKTNILVYSNDIVS